MDNHLFGIIIFLALVIVYCIGIYVGTKQDKTENSIRWQQAYNKGFDAAKYIYGPPKYDQYIEQLSEHKWKSCSVHTKKIHRTAERRKWMQ